MRQHKWAEYDIVMYQKDSMVTRTWIGYIEDSVIDPYGYISVCWWDSELKYRTEPQSMPVSSLTFIGRVVDSEGRLGDW